MALRMLPVGSREEKMSCRAQCRQTIDKPMARHLFLVSRHEARLYEYLLERFRDDGNVEVILDRRRSDRRTRREIDLELQVRSHVILTLPESAPPTRS